MTRAPANGLRDALAGLRGLLILLVAAWLVEPLVPGSDRVSSAELAVLVSRLEARGEHEATLGFDARPDADWLGLIDETWFQFTDGEVRVLWTRPDQDEVRVKSTRGAVTLHSHWLDPALASPVEAALELRQTAAALGWSARLGVLRHDALLDDAVLDTPQGRLQRGPTWRREADTVLQRQARASQVRARAELREARDDLEEWIEESALDVTAREALVETLDRLDERTQEGDEYPGPEALRRMVRHGWLERISDGDARATELREAIELGSELRLVARERSERGTIELWQDGFGRSVRTLRSAELSRYEVALPPPAYFGDTSPLTLVVDLPPGTDPFQSLDEAHAPIAARVYSGAVTVASWSVTQGFRADPEVWRRLASPSVDADSHVLRDVIAPHVLLISPAGDVLRLVTAHGEVVPRNADTPEGIESFLQSAATALPDAAHLDLLGEYLYAYAYDSPDSSRIELVGTERRSGEIHQTVEQSLRTETGGVYRGDCDDLSELYQEIVRRQGRNAHMIGLPAHAALAWSEQDEQGGWRTYVLQTAPPLEVAGASLENSLETTYQSFDPEGVLNTDQLEVMLRFSGDNTRDSYRLSSRIFADPDYARALIELQEDWHDWTLYAGLRKGMGLAGRPDAGPPEWLELASLLEHAGRFHQAEYFYQRAREAAKSPRERALIGVQELEALANSGDVAGTRKVAERLIEEWIPLAEQDEPNLALRLSVVEALYGEKLRDSVTALRVLARDIAPLIRSRKSWYRSAEDRERLEDFMSTSIETLRATPELRATDDWRSLARQVELWLRSSAFLRDDESENELFKYALLGRYGEARRGVEDFRELARKLPAPAQAYDHARARSGTGLGGLDERWIGVSAFYWWNALRDVVRRDGELDRAAVLELAQRTREAHVRAAELGLDDTAITAFVRLSHVVTALAARNPERLASALVTVRESSDRALRETAAFWVAEIGRRTPLPSFEKLLDVAQKELPERSFSMQIAWRLGRAGAHEHALLTARKLASLHPGDRVIAEEYRYLSDLASLSGQEKSTERESEPLF